ncbi:hypothetical protein ACWD0A_10540 [Streptomyces sp. NPDC002867]
MTRTWFQLPPGYIDIDLDDLEHLAGQLRDDVAVLSSGSAFQDQLDGEPGRALGLLGDLREQGTMFAALGVHADDDEGVSTSLLSLSEVTAGACTSTLAGAHSALRLAETHFGTVVRRQLVELPCSAGAALVTCLLPTPFPARGNSTAIAPVPQGVFQARLSVPRPSGPQIIIIDLTTTAVGLSDDYTEILLGVGRTVAFHPPTPQPDTAPPRSRLAELAL